MTDVPLHRQAYLDALEGRSVPRLADDFGVSIRTVEGWLDEASREVVMGPSAAGPASPPPPDPAERCRYAEILLNQKWGPVLYVERPSDPDWERDAGDLMVGFNDVASHLFSDLVDETVGLVEEYPGVATARRDDRELIVVWGDPEIDSVSLENRLRHWWEQRLKLISEGKQ